MSKKIKENKLVYGEEPIEQDEEEVDEDDDQEEQNAADLLFGE